MQPTANVLRRAQYLFGTICRIEAHVHRPQEAQAAVQAGFDALLAVERCLNPHNPDSELSRLNARAARQPMPVSSLLFHCILRALDVCAATEGRYDITAWPLLSLWRDHARIERRPSAAALDAAVSAIDYRNVCLDVAARTVAFADERIQIDLSSIVKGFALDRALEAMRAFAIESAGLDAGGELLFWRLDGEPVCVGIADPLDRGTVRRTVWLRNRAVATSGQGETRLSIGGRAIGHVFDVRTGLPLSDDRPSATVIAADAATADLLSTAAFVLGEARLHPLQSFYPDSIFLFTESEAPAWAG